jgi:hypothetical protein
MWTARRPAGRADRSGAGHRMLQFLGRVRRAQVVVAVVCVLLGPIATALGQERTPTPSAKELWETYPLDPKPDSEATATPTAAATPARRVNAPAAASEAAVEVLVPATLAALAVAAGLLGAFLTLRSRRDAQSASGTPDPDDEAPGVVEPAASSTATREPAVHEWVADGESGARPRPAAIPLRRQERRSAAARASRPGRSSPAAPPDRTSSWTAEIAWAATDAGARFRVVGRTGGEDEATVIAESPPLEWPPKSAAAVEDLTLAVAALERALLAEGWTALEPGSEWYAKRFAWDAVVAPAPAQRRPRMPTPSPAADHDEKRPGRFVPSSAWPEGTESLWRCEVRWKAGAEGARFAAVAYGPGKRRGRAVEDPAACHWPGAGKPDFDNDEYRRELRRLATALHAAGWERLGRGEQWYSARFLWRGTEPPPRCLENDTTARSEEETWKDRQKA